HRLPSLLRRPHARRRRRRQRPSRLAHQPLAGAARGRGALSMPDTTTERSSPGLAAVREHQGPDIWCEDLVRIYSTEGVEVQALQGLNLVVDPGDVVALVGASGSGKSTLLGILSGLDRPTGGRARV